MLSDLSRTYGEQNGICILKQLITVGHFRVLTVTVTAPRTTCTTGLH